MKLLHGDCLELMAQLPDGSIDMILCDLPYGTTVCKWDSVLPIRPLFDHYLRILKNDRAIVLTATQPFSSQLVTAALKQYKYQWVWDKTRATGHLNAKKQPMRQHEEVLVFSKGKVPYYPQGMKECRIAWNRGGIAEVYGRPRIGGVQTTTNYPKSILTIKAEKNGLHPTQKPVALMEYLIRTYTNEGETVLDNCMGSGTTAIACLNTRRRFIGMEKEEKYFNIAHDRVVKHLVGDL